MDFSQNQLPDALKEAGFWNLAKRKIVFFVLERFGEYQKITQSDHTEIKRFITSTPTLSIFQITCLNAVLEKLEGIGWDVRYASLPQKRERPNSLPSTVEELERYDHMIRKRELMWTSGLAENSSLSNIEQAIELELAATYGLGPDHIQSFFNTFPDSINDNQLKIRPHPSCINAPTCNFPLSARMSLLSLHLQTLNLKKTENTQQVTYRLHFKRAELRALTKHAVISGIEPIIATQLQKNVLPVSPSRDQASYAIEKTSNETYPKIYFRERNKVKAARENTDGIELRKSKKRIDPTSFNLGSNLPYSAAAISALRGSQLRLRQALKINGKYNSARVDLKIFTSCFSDTKNRFVEILREYVSKEKLTLEDRKKALIAVDQLHSVVTPVDLAMNIAFDQLIIRHNKSNTLFSYISSVFFNGFFLYQECFDLSYWTNEDTDLFQAEFLFELENFYEPNTVKKVISGFHYVISHAKHHLGVLNEFSTKGLTNSTITLTNRNNIIGLVEFELALKKLHRKADDESLRYAVFWCLEFSGFFRTSEVAALTLNDVEIYGNELFVRVRETKTPSGKRSVPLHLIMPPNQRLLVIELIELRRRQHRIAEHKYKASKTKSGKTRIEKLGHPAPRNPTDLEHWPLFTEDNNTNINDAHLVVEESLRRLKHILGPYVDLYLLRHSGGSHLFSRWYATRYENFITSLSDRNHWAYSSEGLAGLKEFFIEPTNQPLSSLNTSSITHMIKLFGHANTTTFFKVYVHGFDVVASHAMKRVFENEDSFILNGKTISALVPNMKSRRSQSKIDDRSIRNLVSMFL